MMHLVAAEIQRVTQMTEKTAQALNAQYCTF